MKMFSRRLLLILAGFSLYACQSTPAEQTGGESTEMVEVIDWQHLSSLKRDLPPANVGEQVSTLIFDIDQDGNNDFVIAGWGKPSMVWFKRKADGWDKYVVDEDTEFI